MIFARSSIGNIFSSTQVKIDFKFVMMKREIFVTDDGSHSVLNDEMQTTYHSRYGAIRESRHVFIENGLQRLESTDARINIFEMGFGTGLNALLTLIEAEKNHQEIYYETIELFPLEKDLYERLNYCAQLQREDLKDEFEKLHHSEWEMQISIHSFFNFRKLNTSLADHTFNKLFDIIFYDAFAPKAQPELWTKEIFEKLFAALNPKGSLVTYCSKGDVQRKMKAAGFIIEKLAGPPHKREILRAVKE